MRITTSISLAAALVVTQACVSGMLPSAAIGKSNEARPTVAGSIGHASTGGSGFGAARTMPGAATNLPLPATATPYHALAAPNFNARSSAQVLEFADAVAEAACMLPMGQLLAGSSYDNDCLARIAKQRAFIRIAGKKPVMHTGELER